MTRFRRVGLAFVFSVTLAGGVLVAQPAQAFTLPPAPCARLAGAITTLTELAAKYPDNGIIAFLLRQAKEAFDSFCS